MKTYKYRLNPTPKQREALGRTLDLCRDLYNCALEQRRRQRISQFEQERQLSDLKGEFLDYKTVYSQVLQNVLKRLNRWATFFSFLSYKAEDAGREFIEVDARFTSQTCPSCGNRKKKPLSQRKHSCSECGYTTHRDTAAAQVVLARAGPSSDKVGDLIPCLA